MEMFPSYSRDSWERERQRLCRAFNSLTNQGTKSRVQGSHTVSMSITKPKFGWLAIAGKIITQEMCFDWKGIWASFRKPANWGEGRFLSKGQLCGVCLSQGFLKWFKVSSKGNAVVCNISRYLSAGIGMGVGCLEVLVPVSWYVGIHCSFYTGGHVYRCSKKVNQRIFVT